MIDSTILPTFTFIADDGSERVLNLAEATGRIRAVGDLVRRRFPAGSVVGLMFTSGPDLVINWLGCLYAGMRPLVMQYPTRKQSREYWAESVRNTIDTAGLAGVLADKYCEGLGLATLCALIGEDELASCPPGGSEPLLMVDFEILQLSSGTTGFRKAIAFSSRNLARHVEDFNRTLGLSKADKIVSWLPLYHDMGYVACFVMPMMLGIDVVMMDPMTWIRRPELLNETIERHRGTVCYMPNFGFELMARCKPASLPSMRWWISCSEPVSAVTARKFIENIGAAPDSFAPCYAMAENIFAVTLRRGVKSVTIDESDVVACGTPIAGVELKIVDDEIWVKSPTSLEHYIGLGDCRDADGFYPTGDLGRMIDGDLYVTGRKQDLLIQAGKKYMLSDIDLVLNQFYPDVKGRAAAVNTYDARLGTQKPIVLIEAKDFFKREDGPQIANALQDAVGIDQIEVRFVPPRFLTKTSSGKFNRKKSAQHWNVAEESRKRSVSTRRDAEAEMRSSFPGVAWDRPVREVLDSLSTTVVRILLSETGVPYNAGLSLNEIAALVSAANKDGQSREEQEVIRIVSLADGITTRMVGERHIDWLANAFGSPVSLEHICLPPSPILLSDLIFHDYFQPRLEDQSPFVEVDRAFAKLRSASIILVDDKAEMFFPPRQVYGVLSHNLERDPRSDLVAVRWPKYTLHHHRLPLTVVSGTDLPLDDRSKLLADLGLYLNKPIFKIATIPGFREHTADWDYQSYGARLKQRPDLLDPNKFVSALSAWASQRALERQKALSPVKIEMLEPGHMCSAFANKDYTDKLIDRFNSFCLVGQTASVPYIAKELERKGKPFILVPSYAPEIIDTVPKEYECVLICGAMGKFSIDRPAAAIMNTGLPWVTQHIDAPELASFRRFSDVARGHQVPESGQDWYYPYEMVRGRNIKEVVAVRLALRARKRKLVQNLKRRAARKQAGPRTAAE
jgi:acyl-CoA synthetase (AMP-forming)/AMP-acid ligase II